MFPIESTEFNAPMNFDTFFLFCTNFILMFVREVHLIDNLTELNCSNYAVSLKYLPKFFSINAHFCLYVFLFKWMCNVHRFLSTNSGIHSQFLDVCNINGTWRGKENSPKSYKANWLSFFAPLFRKFIHTSYIL